MCGSMAGDWVAGESINYGKAAVAGVVGGIFGWMSGGGAQHGQTGSLKAAVEKRTAIKIKNAMGGYKNKNNYQFALKSNAKRIASAQNALNRNAISKIFQDNSDLTLTALSSLLMDSWR